MKKVQLVQSETPPSPEDGRDRLQQHLQLATTSSLWAFNFFGLESKCEWCQAARRASYQRVLYTARMIFSL